MAKDTRLRMLEITTRLIQHKGYHGTSLNDILEESGAPRGSLYFHFPGGKNQLVVEATRTTIDQITEELRKTLAAAKSPAQGVRAFIEMAAEVLRETDYTYGCPVAPIILDATDGVEEIVELCREAFEEWLGLLRDSFLEAGLLASRAHALALLVEATIEGSLLIGRAYRDSSLLRTVAVEMEAAVEAALQRSRQDGGTQVEKVSP